MSLVLQQPSLKRELSVNSVQDGKKFIRAIQVSKKARTDDYSDDLSEESTPDSRDMTDIFEYFTTDDESYDNISSDTDEKFLLYDFDLVPAESLPINTTNMEFESALRCPNHHGKIAIPWNVDSKVVSKLDDLVAIRHDRMLITTATKPFHIEWCNAGWTQFSGWSSEEVIGLDCQFLQGNATDKSVVSAFMEMLEMSGGFADMTVVNYSKYHVPLRNTIHCFPISDNCGFSNETNITHIGVVLLESKEIVSPNPADELIRANVNLQFDRREKSQSYPYVNCTPAPKPMEWMTMTKDFTISMMLRYIMRSQAPIILTDSDGKIIHVNSAWVELTHFRAAEVESVALLDMLTAGSKPNDLKKLAELFDNSDVNGNNEFKRPYCAKYMCQLGVNIKRRIGDIPDVFKDFVRKTPAQLAAEKDPCQFCQIYDENAVMMSRVNDYLPISVSAVRFNSEHVAILFSS